MRVLANHAFPQNHNFQKPLCSGVNPIILLGANFVILPNLPSPLHPHPSTATDTVLYNAQETTDLCGFRSIRRNEKGPEFWGGNLKIQGRFYVATG